MSFPATAGELTFDDTGDRIDAATTAGDFSRAKVIVAGMIRHDGRRTRCQLAQQMVCVERFDVTVNFDGDRLVSVELFSIGDSEGKSWDDWSMASEMARKARHEAWAQRVFGAAMQVKPFFMPHRIVPFQVKEDTARYLQFPWGQVVSSYDSKSGAAGMTMLYGVRDPA